MKKNINFGRFRCKNKEKRLFEPEKFKTILLKHYVDFIRRRLAGTIPDGSTPPVSVHLPKSQKVYHSERIFPVFTNMLPEGANRRALCRARKVDENDFFGMLESLHHHPIIF